MIESSASPSTNPVTVTWFMSVDIAVPYVTVWAFAVIVNAFCVIIKFLEFVVSVS